MRERERERVQRRNNKGNGRRRRKGMEEEREIVIEFLPRLRERGIGDGGGRSITFYGCGCLRPATHRRPQVI